MPETSIDVSISYTPGNDTATYSGPDPIKVKPGNKVNVTFNLAGSDSFAQAVLLAGPKTKGQGPSPFAGGSPINLNQSSSLVVGGNTGRWCFSVSFTVTTASGDTKFYYLPDPEIDVDPIG